MTILVTATATLVYLHSRFVERPPDRDGRRAPDLRATQQVRRLHGVDLRDRGRLRGARRLRHPPDPRDGHLGRARPGRHVGDRVHALPGAAEDPANADRTGTQDRGGVVPALRRVAAALRPTAGAGRSSGARCCSRRSARSRSSASPASSTPMQILTNPVEYMNHAGAALPGHPAPAAADPRPVDHAGVAQGQPRQRLRARGADRARTSSSRRSSTTPTSARPSARRRSCA